MVESFTATALWQHTLAPRARHDDHRQQRERLRASYLALRDNATVLLAEAARTTPSFTVHDITHVDALWETASLVCGDSTILTPTEAYVLGCAFVLHDAAMGLAAYKEGLAQVIGSQRWRDLLAIEFFNSRDCWPDDDELNNPPTEIIDTCVMRAIRESHAAHASRLVDQPWTTSAGNELYLISDVHLREAYGPLIGELAASHWWNIDLLAGKFKQPKGSLPWQPADWIIEPLKLACALRLADATQIDSRRAPTFLFTLRQPQGESYHHWRFQEHISRPQLTGDRVTYTSLRPFGPDAAEAWWLALDYLREVDRELKRVDSLLHDMGHARLATRAVAGVDSPERFADLFPVVAWRPVDAALRISDVPALVNTLGGQQLYGKEPEVAIRELIQNAHDAVLARSAIDPEFTEGFVEIRLEKEEESWILSVRDNGIGMDEDILVHGLLDFGRSGWNSNYVRTKFPGLAGSGFQPRGRFGIGFFSVFMLGDHVDLITRRYDGAYADARQVLFDSVNKRPIVTTPQRPTRAAHGTTIRVVLNTDPYDTGGIFRQTPNDLLSELVQRLTIENAIPIRTVEPIDEIRKAHPPFSLANSSTEEIFDRLYPPIEDFWQPGREKLRLLIRDAFTRRATSLFYDNGRQAGLATLGSDLYYQGRFRYRGIVPVNGLLADQPMDFMGYINGVPSRASRDQAELAVSNDGLRHWLRSQEQQLRKLGEFTDSMQLELAYIMHRILGELAPDHAIALTKQGVLRVDSVGSWAANHDEIFLAEGIPLSSKTRPPRVIHYITGMDLILEENWVTVCDRFMGILLANRFPVAQGRDPNFAFARGHRDWTWEKQWWHFSGMIEGELLRNICASWSCDIGDLLAPIAERGWNDFAQLNDPAIGPVYGYRLRRPR